MNIETLLKTNVNDHIEKKNNLSYLSWAWAWAEALKADPKATYKVEMFGDKCFMDINGTAMVWVTVTMFDKPMTCQLPVMNYKNQAILNPDAFAVNTAIMRCMTKALSLHGLGLYIYAGEDLPEEDKVQAPKAITPTAGAMDNFSAEEKELLHAVAEEVSGYMKSDLIDVAYRVVNSLESDQKLAVWSILDSKTRSAIKKHAELSKDKK